jgi:N utilization substance protein B
MSQAKTNARRCAVQALYQWQMTGQNIGLIELQFHEDDRLQLAQKNYFSMLFHGVPAQLDGLDAALAEFVDRPVEKIDPVERAILRLGVYELVNRLEIPYRVVINEAVDLAKYFGADGSHKYVNGILDKVAQKQRSTEVGMAKKPRKQRDTETADDIV